METITPEIKQAIEKAKEKTEEEFEKEKRDNLIFEICHYSGLAKKNYKALPNKTLDAIATAAVEANSLGYRQGSHVRQMLGLPRPSRRVAA